MNGSVALFGRVNDRPRQHQNVMCAGLLALLLVGNVTAQAQAQAPRQTAPPQRQPVVAPVVTPAVSSNYQFSSQQPAVRIPRVRPAAGHIIQASAQQLTVVEPRLLPVADRATTEHGENTAAIESQLGAGPDFASQLPDDDSHMMQFIEVMQWTVLVLLVAVVAVIGIKKYGRGNLVAPRNSDIAHLATLPVKNFFQAHLLQIGTQKFLVTTDRTGVKTVNPINAWDDLDSPILDNHDAAVAA